MIADTTTVEDLVEQARRKQWRIDKPRPGVALLACRCGRPLSVGTMRRHVPARDRRVASTVVHRIVCQACGNAR